MKPWRNLLPVLFILFYSAGRRAPVGRRNLPGAETRQGGLCVSWKKLFRIGNRRRKACVEFVRSFVSGPSRPDTHPQAPKRRAWEALTKLLVVVSICHHFTFTFTFIRHDGKTHNHRPRGDTTWRAQNLSTFQIIVLRVEGFNLLLINKIFAFQHEADRVEPTGPEDAAPQPTRWLRRSPWAAGLADAFRILSVSTKH